MIRECCTIFKADSTENFCQDLLTFLTRELLEMYRNDLKIDWEEITTFPRLVEEAHFFAGTKFSGTLFHLGRVFNFPEDFTEVTDKQKENMFLFIVSLLVDYSVRKEYEWKEES